MFLQERFMHSLKCVPETCGWFQGTGYKMEMCSFRNTRAFVPPSQHRLPRSEQTLRTRITRVSCEVFLTEHLGGFEPALGDANGSGGG
jgi:hypothetical protein